MTIERVAGIMKAAPTPWTTRLTISHEVSGARPAVAEESREQRHPEQEAAPAPEDVAEPPAGGEQHGEAERVGVDRPLEAGEARARSSWIDGRATLTTVLSSMIMNSAKHIAPSVHHLALSSVIRWR